MSYFYNTQPLEPRTKQEMEEPYTLFYNDYSICSVMVRYTIALSRHLQGEQLNIEEQSVNIQQGGQLTEYYLCEVNPRGTVSQATSTVSPKVTTLTSGSRFRSCQDPTHPKS